MYGAVPFDGVALIEVDCPMQIVPDPEEDKFTGPFTNTVIVSEPVQEFASVTFTVYVVVEDGNAFVLAAFGVCRLSAGDQE